jgi:hypothetical protein
LPIIKDSLKLLIKVLSKQDLGIKSFMLIKPIKVFRLLSLKLTLKLKSILSLAKSKRDLIKLISMFNTINKEANKLLDFVKEVYLFKFKKKEFISKFNI